VVYNPVKVDVDELRAAIAADSAADNRTVEGAVTSRRRRSRHGRRSSTTGAPGSALNIAYPSYRRSSPSLALEIMAAASPMSIARSFLLLSILI
jgi:hypothetical protein